ncbi:MAG: 50S ribosomal protein L19e [Candidatus Woesearchaeota archaeon]
MQLTSQKRLAAQILKVSPYKIRIDPNRLDDVKECITKADIRGLIIDNAITAKPVKNSSKGRIRLNLEQKRKGRQSGKGSRKGRLTARSDRKTTWVHKIRKQRIFLQDLKLKNMLTTSEFRELYMKAKGGFFRSKDHLKLYINERGYIKKK